MRFGLHDRQVRIQKQDHFMGGPVFASKHKKYIKLRSQVFRPNNPSESERNRFLKGRCALFMKSKIYSFQSICDTFAGLD